VSRAVRAALLAVLLAASVATLADLDREAVDFKTPAEITWVRNAAGTNEQAVLLRRSEQAGPLRVCVSNGCRQHEPAALPSQRPVLRGDLRHVVDGDRQPRSIPTPRCPRPRQLRSIH
jgi:hypothetical protein